MRRRPRQLSFKECYEILKLDKGADLQAVKRAYRRRAFELHPDLNPGNADASRQFQLLNEAYVALSAVFKPVEDARRKDQARRAARAEGPAASGEAQAEERREQTEQPTGAPSGNSQGAPREEARTSAQANSQAASGTSRDTRNESQTEPRNEPTAQQAGKASNAYAEQDVLRDLLNDPFARRVFEDIYSELNRQQADQHQNEAPKNAAQPRPAAQEKKSTKLHQGNLAWGTPKWNLDFNKGVKGVVKDWLRRQIDEEQSLTLPTARLAPGRRVRLQIRRGLSGELHTVEITLPPDFAVGKPVRLRGLGKRVGPWQGDLYLTLYNE